MSIFFLSLLLLTQRSTLKMPLIIPIRADQFLLLACRPRKLVHASRGLDLLPRNRELEAGRLLRLAIREIDVLLEHKIRTSVPISLCKSGPSPQRKKR